MLVHEVIVEATELTKGQVRDLALKSKEKKGLTWPQIAQRINKNPVYAAMLVYGYGQATEDEARELTRLLELPQEANKTFLKPPHRVPVQPWPPTDPFVYRFYEIVMLYGPVFKDLAHEQFGDGIMSAIDMSVDLKKVQEEGVDRMVLTFNGKWLKYKKF